MANIVVAGDAARLFGLILPREGWRATAVQWQPKDSDHPSLFTRLFQTDAQMAEFLVHRGQRTDTWFSTATFRDVGEVSNSDCGFKGRRDSKNVLSRQCFHADRRR